jgi:hypothetical protein
MAVDIPGLFRVQKTQATCPICNKKFVEGEFAVSFIAGAYGSHINVRIAHEECLLKKFEHEKFTAEMKPLVHVGKDIVTTTEVSNDQDVC